MSNLVTIIWALTWKTEELGVVCFITILIKNGRLKIY